MSLRHTETNLRHTNVSLRHTEASLTDRQSENEPPPYSTRASAVQKDFFETLVNVIIKDLKKYFDAVETSVTKDYN